MKDYSGEQKLKDVQVGRKKLGADWAKKIYAVLLGVKYADAIMWNDLEGYWSCLFLIFLMEAVCSWVYMFLS